MSDKRMSIAEEIRAVLEGNAWCKTEKTGPDDSLPPMSLQTHTDRRCK